VTKKNRKVRRLRELYPDVRCKIFYQRDYVSLLVKYGLESPAAIPPGTAEARPAVLDLGITTGDLRPAAPEDPEPTGAGRRHAKPRAS
jgi:hypothetical protein